MTRHCPMGLSSIAASSKVQIFLLVAIQITSKSPDVRLSHHCREETLFSPNATEELEDAVARYAKDNLLVVRVRKNSLLDEDALVLSV